jgi:uncharacterized protein (DUF2237 family)
MADLPEGQEAPVLRPRQLNVFGEPLAVCCTRPLTGFYRTGSCETSGEDAGTHVVCAQMTEDFLAYSVARGNDLVTPAPQWGFPGLKPGDCWCVCALRWVEALHAGVAPPVRLASTHAKALEFVPLATLQAYALETD